MVRQLTEVIETVETFWQGLKSEFAVGPGAGPNLSHMHGRMFVRDALEIGQLEAREVYLAERLLADFRHHLHREYKRRVEGDKVIRAYDNTMPEPPHGPLQLKAGRLTYVGPIPFKSPEYLEAEDRMPWEREDTNPKADGQVPDAGMQP